jgi:uncharacterized protein YcnI
VTVQPGSVPQGGYTAVAFRVPDESDTASTVKLEVSLPMDHPMASVRIQPLPGWTAVLEKSKLDKPLSSHGKDITEAVSKITWTADAGTKIAPGQFQEFRVSLGAMPTDTDKLTFKALQTYTGGEVVRWIGAEDSDNPAPVVSVNDGAAAAATPAPTQAAATATPAAAESSDDGGNGLAIVALIVGALGLVLGGAGLLAARRANARSGVAA